MTAICTLNDAKELVARIDGTRNLEGYFKMSSFNKIKCGTYHVYLTTKRGNILRYIY